MVRLIEFMCKEEGWGSCTYAGHVTATKKDEAIEAFSTKKDKRVMVATLKSAGIGLNLTAARRVVNMDSWYVNIRNWHLLS